MARPGHRCTQSVVCSIHHLSPVCVSQVEWLWAASVGWRAVCLLQCGPVIVVSVAADLITNTWRTSQTVNERGKSTREREGHDSLRKEKEASQSQPKETREKRAHTAALPPHTNDSDRVKESSARLLHLRPTAPPEQTAHQTRADHSWTDWLDQTQ